MSASTVLLRPDEAARQLNISRSKVYMLLKSGELPCVRIGRSVRVPQDRLAEFVSPPSKGPSAAPTAYVDVDVEATLERLGLSKLRPGVKALQIAPAVVKFADALKNASPLIRHVAREELLSRLTKAKVRSPAQIVTLAFEQERL